MMRQLEDIQILYAFHAVSLPKNEHDSRAHPFFKGIHPYRADRSFTRNPIFRFLGFGAYRDGRTAKRPIRDGR